VCVAGHHGRSCASSAGTGRSSSSARRSLTASSRSCLTPWTTSRSPVCQRGYLSACLSLSLCMYLMSLSIPLSLSLSLSLSLALSLCVYVVNVSLSLSLGASAVYSRQCSAGRARSEVTAEETGGRALPAGSLRNTSTTTILLTILLTTLLTILLTILLLTHEAVLSQLAASEILVLLIYY